MSGDIDFRAIIDQVSLRAMIEADLGKPDRSRSWSCPYHDDRRKPNLKLSRDGKHFRCWACGASGTALDWKMRREGLDIVEAARALNGQAPLPTRQDQGSGRPSSPSVGEKPAQSPPPGPPPWQDPEWQRVAGELVRRAEAILWSTAGRRALEWLRGRGLEDRTIRQFRLGFLPEPIRTEPLTCLGPDAEGRPRGIYAFRGVTIPMVAPEVDDPASPDSGPAPTWCGVTVRRLTEEFTDPRDDIDKCMAFLGSRFGYAYPLPTVTPGVPALITEGHIDALLAMQEAGPLVNPMTIGGATHRPRPETLTALDACPVWLLALDHDRAGREAVEAVWGELAPKKVRRLVLPFGKDLGQYVQGGGDVPAWLASEFRRLGLPWPLRERPAGESLLDLTSRLCRRGIRLDGEIVYPRIAVGTITGRVTYTSPALQTLPKAERLERIGPVVEGRVFVRADLGQIEPRILLKILRDRGLITWDVAPHEDLYRVLVADASIDRDEVKVLVNKIVNGGRHNGPAAGRFAEFIRASDAYRDELAAGARTKGSVRTLGGRRVLLPAGENNHGGKSVNRVVQGTAADIFNRACVAVDRAIEVRGLPAAVSFLLYDELWVEADPAAVAEVQDRVRAEMEAVALADGVAVPVRFAGQKEHS